MKHLLPVLIALSCIMQQSRAADIIVGPQLEIADLQTAVSLANDGDRILVTAGTYWGNVSINKSITMLPLVEGTRYTVNGRVYCGGAGGKRIQLSGIRVLSSIHFESTLSSRLDLLVFDSYVLNFFGTESQQLLRLELYRDTIYQGGWGVGSCAMFGCHVMWAIGQLPQAIYLGGSALPDENWFIGNVFHQLIGTRAFNVINANRPFHIENNLAYGDGPFMMLNGGGLNAPMPMCTILNNTIIDTGNDGVLDALIDNGEIAPPPAIYYAVTVKNNARVGTGNAADLSMITAPFMTASHNVVAPPSAVNSTNGQATNGSPLINAGDPDPRYLDLDLSANDAGCYGGSNSLENFSTPMGSAVVGFMRAPRIVSQGASVSISATGFDR